MPDNVRGARTSLLIVLFQATHSATLNEGGPPVIQSDLPAFLRSRRLWQAFALLVPMNLIGALLVWHYFPDSHDSFLKEDQAVENITASLFFFAFILGSINLCRVRSIPNVLFYFPIPLIGLIGFLDELSWGERVSRKHAPVMIKDGVKIDGMHDFLVLIDRTLNPILSENVSSFLARYSFLALLICTWLLCSAAAIAVRRRFPALLFLIPAVAFVFVGKYLDVREKIQVWIGPYQLRIVTEEMMELNGALSLLFAALAIGVVSRVKRIELPKDLPANTDCATEHREAKARAQQQ